MVRAGSPSRQALSPNSSAVNPRRRSWGRPSKRSPARLTSRSLVSLSKVKMARSISSKTVHRSAAAAERKIFFAQGGQEIRKCLQGKDHAIANRESKTQPKGNDEECQCPDRSRRIISAPEEDQGDERTWNASSQRKELDAALVSQLLHSSPCFCSRRYMALRLNPKALAAWLTFPSWRESVRWMR